MNQTIADKFTSALRVLEADRDVAPMMALFSDECEVGNVAAAQGFHGRAEAQEFWEHYRDHFGRVSSTFRNQILCDGKAALEWTTEGTDLSGGPIRYEGVSILETDGNQITRFYAYFNPNHFSQHHHQPVTEAEEKGYGR